MSTPIKNNSSAVGLDGNNSKYKPKSKWWLWLLILLLVVVIVIFALIKWQKDTMPIQPVETLTVVSDTALSGTVTEETLPNDGKEYESAESIKTTEANSVSSTTSQTNLQSSEDYDEIAKNVVRGDYGNGLYRENALGDKYQEVQRRVNEGKEVWWKPID
jgi:cytoskeletal protein RodZ